MGSTRHYRLNCDHQGCDVTTLGGATKTPSEIRKTLARIPNGWTSRKRPPTKFQREHGIVPTDDQDFCPVHRGDAL